MPDLADDGRLKVQSLYGWIGEDREGEIGLKCVVSPMGVLALVGLSQENMTDPFILAIARHMAREESALALCEFRFVRVVRVETGTEGVGDGERECG